MFKKIRKLSGLTQAEFSRKYNIPLRTIQDWESERRTPPEYVISLLEKAVNEDIKKQEEIDISNDRYLKGLIPGTVKEYVGSKSRPTFSQIFDIVRAAKCDIELIPDTSTILDNMEGLTIDFHCSRDFEYELMIFDFDEFEENETTYVTYTGRMNAEILYSTMSAFAYAGGLHYAKLFLGVVSDLSEKEDYGNSYKAHDVCVNAAF